MFVSTSSISHDLALTILLVPWVGGSQAFSFILLEPHEFSKCSHHNSLGLIWQLVRNASSGARPIPIEPENCRGDISN